MTTALHTDRTLHLVDLENLVGDPRATGPIVRHTLDRYLETAAWRPGDQVLVASNPRLIGEVMFDLPVPCNVHAVHGPDAADVMLLSHAPPELVVKRYRRLVVGSGDWIFAGRARAAQQLGVDVLVVARAGSCANVLRRFEHRLLAADLGLAA